jgi:hypothetical protein
MNHSYAAKARSRSSVPLLLAGAAAALFASSCAPESPEMAKAAPPAADAELRLGTRVHVMPYGAQPQPQLINAAAQTLTYYGGRVVSNLRVVEVLWGSGNYLPNVANSSSPSIATFYQGVLNSSHVDWLDGDYNTVNPNPSSGSTRTNQHIGRGSFAGLYAITPSSGASTISDSTIQNEIAAQIQAGNLPAPAHDAAGNNNTYYAVFFPPGKTITQGGSSSCVAGGFCAYHGTVANVPGVGEIYYGVHPDMQAGSGCATGCGNSSTFQNYTSVASHEMVEAITDAEVGIASTLSPPLAWYNNTYGEVGDICNAQQGSVVGSDGVVYTVQKEWSNSSSACIVAKPVVGNDFNLSVSPSSISVLQGNSGSATISTATTSGSAQTVSLSVSGQPSGMTATLTPTSVSSGQSASLGISTLSTVLPGTYTLTVTGSATSGSHGATLSVTVNSSAPSDFSISANPGSVSVAQGSSGSSTIATATTSGSAQTLSLTVSGAPSGVTATVSPTSVTSGSSSTLSISAASGAAAGTYGLTITGSAPSGTHSTTISLTVTSSGGNVLSNGVPVTNISGALSSQAFWSIVVPASQTSLVVKITGSTSASNDADLYVRLGAQPTLTSYNCRPYLTGSNETCTLTPPAAGGTYFIMLNGYTAYSGVTLTASYSGSSGGGGGNVLTSGVPVSNLSGSAGSQQTWTLAVPSGPTSVRFNITGSTSAGNDADMYVRFGAAPTTTTYDCRPYLTGSNETCNLTARTGTWYVMLRGYTAYSGVTLTGRSQ